MAKVIQTEQSVIIEPWWAKLNGVYIGLSAGLVWWVLTIILRQYVVEPIACRDLSSATACVNSLDVSGNIAAILVAVGAVFALIRYIQPRPIVISIASLAVLWGLAGITNGLAWYWALLAGVVFYGLSYGLFSMVARIPWLWVSLTTAFVIVICTRLLLAL